MFKPISLDEFEERTGNRRDSFARVWDGADDVVSLRDLVEVLNVQLMPVPYLERLIRSVRLQGDPAARPYASGRIDRYRVDPHSLLIGQAFVERGKYRLLLEKFSGFLEGFAANRGIAKVTACIVLGRTADGRLHVAHYLPPIVEKHGDRLLLLDGVHRNFLVKNVGTTIETIVISGVGAPFPCEPQDWAAIRPVDEKPPKGERFFGLQPDLFRDVKVIGIDG